MDVSDEYDEEYNSEFDFIDDYLHFPSPCEVPSECVSAEYCQGKKSKLDQSTWIQSYPF